MKSSLFLFGTALLLCCSRFTWAATFNIPNGDVAALKNAINTANNNDQSDTINLASSGLYTLTSVDNISGNDGPSGLPAIFHEFSGSGAMYTLTINGNGSTIARSSNDGTPDFRIFRITSGANVTISGLTITNGLIESYWGAGILNLNATLSLINCRLVGNNALNGGAIANITDEQATSAELTDCTLSGNSSFYGGGAMVNSHRSEIESAYLTLRNCTLTDNSAGSGGAAIRNYATLILTNCTLVNNSAVYSRGGGLLNESDSEPATAQVSNCTVVSNPGGDIYCGKLEGDDHVTLSSSIVGTIAHDPGGPAGGFTSAGYNLSSSNSDIFLDHPTDQINVNPRFDPAGLQDNGGPTQTIALLAESPALDQGNSFGLITDQRGEARPRDISSIANAPGGDGSDIGAFEERGDPRQGGPIFTVNYKIDQDDGLCGGLNCSLREAIAAANAASDHSTINFASNVQGTITLKPELGQLVVTTRITVTGPGARVLNVSGGGVTRVFNFSGGPSFLSGLTIRDGAASNVSSLPRLGGGLSNIGTLTLSDCTFVNNRAPGGDNGFAGGGGGVGQGGAIINSFGGVLTLNRCTFSTNSAAGGRGGDHSGQGAFGGPGGTGQGGAVFNDSGSTLTLNNCTFSSNSATGGDGGNNFGINGRGGNGGAGNGGGVFNLGTMVLTSATLSNNTGVGGAGGSGNVPAYNGAPGTGSGGLTHGGGASTVRNTISAGNTGNAGADANGAFTSEGYNLIGIGDFSSGFNQTGDQTGSTASPINAKLGPLQDNGGATDTMDLLTGSPALDQGKSFGLTTDQRGRTRPNDNPIIINASGGDGSDIGAVEFAGVLVVTTVADHNDGTCNATDCTLREAINAANAQAGEEVIAFAPGVTGTIQLGAALPNLSTSMILQGPGATMLTVRRNSGGDYRIFTVSNGTTSGPTVTISGLTVANGLAPGGAFPASSGGGILNDHGALTVKNCVLSGNNAALSGFVYGGGIFNHEGMLTVENSTFTANSAYYGGGICSNRTNPGTNTATITSTTFAGNSAPAGYGAGLYNAATNSGSTANLTLINCTLSGNSAPQRSGGAIYTAGANDGVADVTVANCTLSGNSAPEGGGIYNYNFNASAFLRMRNSIFRTGATGANLTNNGGRMISEGHNLSNDGTGPNDGSTDLLDTDPMLGPLQSNGGLTQTHALLSGSAAINMGNDGNAPVADQRGYLRLGVSDIGAFEFGGFQLRIISITRNGSNIAVGFEVKAGKTYRLERKLVVTDPTWQSIPGVNDVTAFVTGPATITDPNAVSLGKAFYRVRLLP